MTFDTVFINNLINGENMKNSELITQIILKLEQEHINLYHDISKQEIEKYIASIKNIDSFSSITFDYEMMKLFAMFKDAHTSYMIPYKQLSHKIMFLNNEFYVCVNNYWKQIQFFGILSSHEFFNKLKPLMNYETQEWLNHMVSRNSNNGYVYQMLNLLENGSIELTLTSGEKLNLKIDEIKVKQNKQINRFLPYDYKILEGNILYLRYSRCFDDKEHPFSSLVDQVSKEIEEKGFTQYILDVRGNSGGNSEILNPFQQLVNEKVMKGCVLIDNGVFSSGRFAVARFKKHFNATLIGQPTGGAAKSYGFTKCLEIEDKKFSVSIRLWDFSDVFGYEGAIQPDIYVKETIEDVQEQRDVVLDTAVKFLKSEIL